MTIELRVELRAEPKVGLRVGDPTREVPKVRGPFLGAPLIRDP